MATRKTDGYMRKIMVFVALLSVVTSGLAQSSAEDAFAAQKIGNLETTKVIDGGELHFNVAHRFGSIDGGVETFFGLDQSNTKIELLYGIMDFMQIGVSRESIRKTYSGTMKMKFLEQKEGRSPLNISGYTSINVNTELREEQYPKMVYYDRLSYASMLMMSRKFGSRTTIEIAPGFVRQNLVLEPFQLHNQFVVGLGGRINLTKNISLNLEYMMNLSRASESVYQDPIAIGLDFETNGHVFQLLFTNAQSTTGPGYLTNAEGDDIFFGFNISRRFKLH